ncbi:MAG TPA: efflux transporter outer membrane subunit [Candidatus Polarisedimenticolaceae bacterium]|nr:efflux transporter outer membrane subunit [Candidatus Polarisedimenticolaceae bacterium]
MRRAIAAGCCLLLVACTVGPDYKAPEPPTVTRYRSESASEPAGPGRDVPAAWWTLFESPALDALVREALEKNPKLEGAQAALRKAQEDVAGKRSARYPQIDARGAVNSVDVNAKSLGAPALPFDTPLTLYDASVSVKYTLDLFGKTRRELEALSARAEYQTFQLEGARLMLAGNVVTAAIRIAALTDQIELTQAIVDVQGKRLEVAQKLESLGGVPHLEVVSQSGDLARTRATLPPLRDQRDKALHRLAIYLGKAPGETELPALRLADLKLPVELPLSLPSELARQRPDIRAAEALLHEASARVGVATANFYPQITLSATAGSLATALGDLLSSGTGFYFIGASLLQPIFHGGQLKAEKRGAVAAFDQAGAAYRETVLTGLQDVADTLSALEHDGTALEERADAAKLADEALTITSQRYDVGGVSYISLLDAQRQHREAVLARAEADAARYADSAALFQALGGGWWTEREKQKEKEKEKTE